jgi:hypothetical protein
MNPTKQPWINSCAPDGFEVEQIYSTRRVTLLENPVVRHE